MARVERYVVGLTERSADRVQLRERVREPSKISKVLEGGVATAVAVTDERTAVDRRENHVVATDVNRPLGVPRLEVELGRGLRQLLDQEFGSSSTSWPSILWPAARKRSSASSLWNSIPPSETSRRQPRSRTAIASSERIS